VKMGRKENTDERDPGTARLSRQPTKSGVRKQSLKKKRARICGEEKEVVSGKTIERSRRVKIEKQQNQQSCIVGDTGPTFGQTT
jgi:hypothetical protein